MNCQETLPLAGKLGYDGASKQAVAPLVASQQETRLEN